MIFILFISLFLCVFKREIMVYLSEFFFILVKFVNRVDGRLIDVFYFFCCRGRVSLVVCRRV